MRERGQVISGFRVTILEKIRKELNIQLKDFYEMETYGKDKVLITFFKVGKRDEVNETSEKEN